jgi:hypothetical protein
MANEQQRYVEQLLNDVPDPKVNEAAFNAAIRALELES